MVADMEVVPSADGVDDPSEVALALTAFVEAAGWPGPVLCFE